MVFSMMLEKFVFEELGYQLEPSEISAAFALIQFDKLSKNMELRNKHFDHILQFLSKYDNFFLFQSRIQKHIHVGLHSQ